MLGLALHACVRSDKEKRVTNRERVMSFSEQLEAGTANVWTQEVVDLLEALPRGDLAALAVTVDVLEGLANGGPALELAIGSGRVALPLAARGIRVDGIENSEPQVNKLRERTGGDQITVTIGDFADVDVAGSYRLIFLVQNTLSSLITQENQIRCFENVAKHLTEDGVFVVEAFTPGSFYAWQGNQYVRAEALDVNFVALGVGQHDPAKQTLAENRAILTRRGVQFYPILTRYVWPSEMDLMARLAGLQLKDRWRSWNREPFTGEASNCISVYGR